MENLIGKPLKKKEFAVVWKLNHSLSPNKWRSEVKKADRYCKWHTEGKGAGNRYFIDEIYETPKEIIHGNKGQEPANKGQYDETALKYKLAKALVLNFAQKDISSAEYLSKRYYKQQLNCHLENFKHIEDFFRKRDLTPIDRLALKLANNTSKSLNGRFDEALELIRKGAFDGVILKEQLWYANFDHEHYEAEEMDYLFDMYKAARIEAEKIVESEHGEILFFSMRRFLINSEYLELIESEEKYKALYENKIQYFYNRYAFIGALIKKEVAYDYESFDYDGAHLEAEYEGENIAGEFLNEFVCHRENKAVELVESYKDKNLKGIVVWDKVSRFAADFTKLLFQTNNFEYVANYYTQSALDIGTIENTGFGIVG